MTKSKHRCGLQYCRTDPLFPGTSRLSVNIRLISFPVAAGVQLVTSRNISGTRGQPRSPMSRVTSLPDQHEAARVAGIEGRDLLFVGQATDALLQMTAERGDTDRPIVAVDGCTAQPLD